MDEFYDELIGKKPTKKDQLLHNLYEQPKRDKGKDMPHIEETEPNYCHQADLLFLPTDDGYKYALVVVDCATGKTDSEPLKEKSASAVLEGFKEIYKRKILKFPQRLETDPGTEFKGVVKKYFNDKGTFVRYGLPGRHRMQALAEQRNKVIGTAITKRQTAQELLTGAPSKEWVEDLPQIVKAIDRNLPKRKTPSQFPTGSKETFEFIPTGTKVRVALDEPIDTTAGKRLHGRFRAGDIKFSQKERVVKQLNLQPNQPPTYLLDGPEGTDKVTNVAYTKNQLQVIPTEEKLPHPSVIRGKATHYIVEKIIGKKKVKGKIEYKVKWRGFPESDATYEPREKLLEDVPNVVKEFEAKKK